MCHVLILKVMVGQWAGELAVAALQVGQEGSRRDLCGTVGLEEGKWDMRQVERLGCELIWGASGSEREDTGLRRNISTRI